MGGHSAFGSRPEPDIRIRENYLKIISLSAEHHVPRRLALARHEWVVASNGRSVMERINEGPAVELIELGVASIETKGPPGAVGEADGHYLIGGIADE